MKNSSLISKILMAAVTLGILTYFGVQIYHYANDPMVTTMAYTYQVENTVEISGSMVRQEQVLEGDGGGLMQLRRSEGERVSSGGAVATVYADQASLDRQNEIETLHNRIDQLEYAQESMLGAEVTLKLDSQISKALLDYRSAAAAGRMDTAENHGQELRALVDKVAEIGVEPDKNQPMFICHANCPDSVAYVKELLKERFGVTDVRADFIGPVIGAHTGCGTLGLFFVGTER